MCKLYIKLHLNYTSKYMLTIHQKPCKLYTKLDSDTSNFSKLIVGITGVPVDYIHITGIDIDNNSVS